MKKQTVLITGASGLIGSSIVDLLLEKGYQVIGLAKKFPLKKLQLPQFSNDNYTIVKGDIRDQKFIEDVLNAYNPNYIIHLAAQAIVGDAIDSADETFDVNIKGTWNLLQEAKKLKNLNRIVVASSDKAYGKHEQLPYQENFTLNAIHPYDISKKITELIALSYYKTYNLPITITRCGNVFGPYDLNFTRIVPETIRSLLKDNKVRLRSDGKQHRCYVFSKDVANAYLKIIEAPLNTVNGEVFNIGNSDSLSVLELVEIICKKIGGNSIAKIIIENSSKYEIQDQSLDCNKAKEVLSWEAIYDLDTALDQTIEWYLKYNEQLSK